MGLVVIGEERSVPNKNLNAYFVHHSDVPYLSLITKPYEVRSCLQTGLNISVELLK